MAVLHQSVGGPPPNETLAEVAELAYAQVSEACAARLEGSTPSFRIFSLEEPHLLRCSVVRLCGVPPGTPPRLLLRALHLKLFRRKNVMRELKKA